MTPSAFSTVPPTGYIVFNAAQDRETTLTKILEVIDNIRKVSRLLDSALPEIKPLLIEKHTELTTTLGTNFVIAIHNNYDLSPVLDKMLPGDKSAQKIFVDTITARYRSIAPK